MEFSKRTWGWWLTLWSAKTFKVKLLYFKAGHSCSLQRHFCRDEDWRWVFGKGKLEKNGGFFKNPAREFIRRRELHKYTAETPTLVLEIQTGDCREEDIERIT